jgi:hypothetical protein
LNPIHTAIIINAGVREVTLFREIMSSKSNLNIGSTSEARLTHFLNRLLPERLLDSSLLIFLVLIPGDESKTSTRRFEKSYPKDSTNNARIPINKKK